MKLIDGAAPLFYPGGDVGCLVIHGHTGAPHSVKWLCDHLAGQGYTVYAPLLSGHGTTLGDLARVSWRDWAADALAGEAFLRARCKKVFGLGVSLGGALCLWLAGQRSPEVKGNASRLAGQRSPEVKGNASRLAGQGYLDGVVGLATPHDHRLGARKLVLQIMSLFGMSVGRPEIPPEKDTFLQTILAEQRRRGEPEIGRVTYGRDPAHAILEIGALLAEMRAGLASMRAPLLLIHSRNDHVVPLASAQRNLDAAGGADKHLLVLESDRHGIAEHPDLMPQVFGAAAAFIAERA